jgi:hypothetical protein
MSHEGINTLGHLGICLSATSTAKYVHTGDLKAFKKRLDEARAHMSELDSSKLYRYHPYMGVFLTDNLNPIVYSATPGANVRIARALVTSTTRAKVIKKPICMRSDSGRPPIGIDFGDRALRRRSQDFVLGRLQWDLSKYFDVDPETGTHSFVDKSFPRLREFFSFGSIPVQSSSYKQFNQITVQGILVSLCKILCLVCCLLVCYRLTVYVALILHSSTENSRQTKTKRLFAWIQNI